ncbi:MAG TPA: hypothetical protein VIL28_16315 [Steroidobacteraceae bacterium]
MRNSIPLTAVALVAAWVSTPADAQNWEFSPKLQLGYEYNDNYRLDFAGQEIEVSGALMDVTLPLRLIDPVVKAEIAPRVRATYFPNERDQDSTDYFLRGLLERRTQRHIAGISAYFSREDVVRSELPPPDIDEGIDGDLGDIETGDAGRVLFRNERDFIQVKPYWNYDVTQRTRTELGGYFIDASYERNFEGFQQDYRDYGVDVGWAFRVSPRSRLALRGLASRYETTFDAEGYGAEVEWRTDYSETTQVYARLGAQRTDLKRANGEAQNSFVGGIGGNWTWPTTKIFLDLTRRVGPSAAGAIVERNQLRFKLSRAIQPRLSFLSGVRASYDEGLDSPTFQKREYVSAEVGFDWRMTRKWSLVGLYHYIWQEYSHEPADTSSNAISVGIVYEPGRGE